MNMNGTDITDYRINLLKLYNLNNRVSRYTTKFAVLEKHNLK